jgi:hypothetical protein
VHRTSRLIPLLLIIFGLGALILSVLLKFPTNWDNRSATKLQTDGCADTKINCGVACVSFLNIYFNTKRNVRDIVVDGAKMCDKNNNISLTSLCHLCTSSGLPSPKTLHLKKISDLELLPMPVILHLQNKTGGHFVICTQVSATHLQVIDFTHPSSIAWVVPITALQQRLTNYVVAFAQ